MAQAAHADTGSAVGHLSVEEIGPSRAHEDALDPDIGPVGLLLRLGNSQRQRREYLDVLERSDIDRSAQGLGPRVAVVIDRGKSGRAVPAGVSAGRAGGLMVVAPAEVDEERIEVGEMSPTPGRRS